ncbi:OmpA family protein [Bacteroidales bacterium OttesenSCG-928-M11]|nr:OmpA family protein [Bacteroidales bacterium OttesenSCG-928-M11]
MKKMFYLAAALLLVTNFTFAQTSVDVQYPGDVLAQKINTEAIQNQTEGKKATSTTWVDNRAKDNWFISGFAGLGGSLTGSIKQVGKPFNAFDSDKDGFWNLSYGGAVGKFYNPTYGFRFIGKYGETSTYGRDINNDYALAGHAEYIYGGVDFMVNLKNLFTSYNPKAFFNPVFYIGPGVTYTMSDDINGVHYRHNWNVALNTGIQLNFRLHDRWDLFLDANALAVPAGFDRDARESFAGSDIVTTASIGLTYRFNFRHFVKADFNDPAIVDGLNRKINELRQENDALRNRPVPVCPECPEQVVVVEEIVPFLPTPVFFTIGSSKVTANQYYAIAEAAKFLKDNPSKKIQLTGYADAETGSANVNQKLSQQRVESVAKVLVDKYGVSENRLVKGAKGDTVQPFSENDWNRVVIFVVD